VWPRVEIVERRTTFNSPIRDWYIALHNVGRAPAGNVRFHTSDDEGWGIMRDSDTGEADVPILAPGSEAIFAIAPSMASQAQVQCVVTWEDSRGPQENEASLRLT
jgi:hypothetical protein